MADFELPSFGPHPGAQTTRAALQRHYDGFRISILNGVQCPEGLQEFTEALRGFLGQLEALTHQPPEDKPRRAKRVE